MTRARRRVAVVGAVAALVISLGYAAFLLGYRLNLSTGDVAVPSASAPPEEISLAYIDAFNHRDRATMQVLFPSGSGVSRFRAMGHYTDIMITGGHPMSDSERAGGVGEGHPEAYLVTVRLTYTGFNDDLAYPPGPNGWNYYLVRDQPTERWTIADQGVL